MKTVLRMNSGSRIVAAALPLLLVTMMTLPLSCNWRSNEDDSPAPGKMTPSQKLAAVHKIALVSFVGKSTASPKGPAYRALTKAMYEAFRSEMLANVGIVEFIPNETVKANVAYQKVTKIQMPEGASSAVEGLTYMEPGATVGALTQSLGVDAVMVVVVRFGISSRSSGGYLTAKTSCALLVPPEEAVWNHMEWPLREESQVVLALWEYPLLALRNMARWVAFMGPSETDANEMMEIALTKEPNAATKAGMSMADDLLNSIRKAR